MTTSQRKQSNILIDEGSFGGSGTEDDDACLWGFKHHGYLVIHFFGLDLSAEHVLQDA